MKRLIRFAVKEDGIAMATVVGMIAVLTLLSVVLIDQVASESRRSGEAVTNDAVFQAAEAGINNYIAKLIDNSGYYDQCVSQGESTREREDTHALVAHATSSTSCAPGGESIWTPGVKWTYPSGKDWWSSGTGDASADTTSIRGYAYNLMIVPPSATSATKYIDVVSTGCKVVDPTASPLVCDTKVPQRAIEVHLRRTTPADFQFMMTSMPTSGSDVVCWASTVYGKMYSSGNIYVCGATFYGNLMAEDRVIVASGYTNPPNVVSPSRIYDVNHPDIRTVIKNSINISSLLASVSQVQRNAQLNSPSLAFDDSTAKAWRLNFSSNGHFQVWKCVNSNSPEADQPYCGPDVKLTSPTTLPASSSTFTLTVSGDISAFILGAEKGSPTTGTVYVGPTSGGRIDKVTYTGVSGNSLTTARCTTCTTAQAHAINEKVSMISGGITWAAPVYDGPIPQNGAIYTAQDAIISWPNAIAGYNEASSDSSPTSKVNGQVTVASNQDMIIAGDIHYASEPAADGIGGTNDDVLGLVAQGSLTLARYAPDKLWFRASTMANGTWGDYACRNGPDRGSLSSLTFVGTSAYAANGGCIHGAGGYGYRDVSGALRNVYRITDDGTAPECPSTATGCMNFNALRYLVPPYYPPLNGIETVLFREVAPSCSFNDSGVLTCG